MSFCTLPKQVNFEQLHQDDFDYLEQFTLRKKILGMANVLQLTNAEIYDRRRIVEQIIWILQPYYPDCNILIFGSSMNGFGFKGCDLDLLFLPFPGYCNLDFVGKGSGLENDSVPNPKSIWRGSFSRERLLFMEDTYHLKFIQRIFQTRRNFIKSVFFVPARCPILSIKFEESQISCDFSASNMLVVYNTELLRLFGSLDARVRPLVIFLRYWAKSLGFIAKSLLSSYAFSLIVIFYLQAIEPPILPSVKQLCERAGYSRLIDGWETAIDFDHLHIFTSSNKTPTEKLLVDFFEFYWNFDFTQNIVSPYHGRPLPIKEVKESNDERIRNFQVTTFSIQDAFVLSRNISRNANMKTPFKFALLIAKKLILCKNSRFQSLFDYTTYQKEMYELTESNCTCLSNFALHLNYAVCCKLGITDNFEPWYKTVCQIVLNILQYGLLIDCEVIDKVIWTEDFHEPVKKKRKVSGNDGNFQLLMSIQCACDIRTIKGRKEGKEVGPEGDDSSELPDILRRDFQTSKQKLQEKTDNHLIIWFLCQCYKYSKTQVPDVFIVFSPLSDLKDFPKEHFFKLFVEKRVKQILESNFSNYCF